MSDKQEITKNGITRREFVKYTAGTMVVLSTGSLLTACGSSSGDAPASSNRVFGSLHPVSSNQVVKELSNLSVTTKDGISSEYAGLVVDGAKMTAAEVSASTAIRDYLRAEKTVLVLNCSGDHKQALLKHTGVSFGTDTSRAYCIIPTAGSQGRSRTILDHPRANVANVADFTKAEIEVNEPLFLANQAKFRNDIENLSGPKVFAASIVKELEANAKLLAGPAAKSAVALSGDSQPQSLPPSLKQTQTRYINIINWSHDNMWPANDSIANKLICPAPSPMQGSQTGTVSSTTMVYLYLDNAASNTNGSYQWLVVDHQGASNPVTASSANVKNTSVAMPLTGAMAYGVYDGPESTGYLTPVGYTQMAYTFDFSPAFSNPSAILHFYDAQPPNENGTTTYSSGYSFDVGFDTDGIGDATAGIDHSTDTEISDWSVKNNCNNASLEFNWTWNSSNPSNSSNNYKKPNTLNTALFQPNASCVMQTNTLQTGSFDFTLNYGVSQISWMGSPYYNRKDVSGCMYSQQITVDFSSVLYPIVQSVSVSPGQVQGGTYSSGTITLDSNAPTGGTVVYLFSSNPNWASVPTTVTVPAGVGSQTFPITTSKVTGNASVTISASLTNVTNNASMNSSLTVTT